MDPKTETEPHSNSLVGEAKIQTQKQTQTQSNGEAPPEEVIWYPTSPARSLPWLLQLLFGLNGLSLSLESLALMYILNSKVEMPLAYLPTYGTIAFLPYSLKPIYGYIISQQGQGQGGGRLARSHLYIGLLMLNGIALLTTCLIPKGGVFLACLVAFGRGVTDSWAELCLGLTLIDHARSPSPSPSLLSVSSWNGNSFDESALASKFQAQAATARNLGAFLGSLMTCLMFVERQIFSSEQTQLSGRVANTLLVGTGLLQFLGAATAYTYRSVLQPRSDPLFSSSLSSSSGHAFTLVPPVDPETSPSLELATATATTDVALSAIICPDEASALRDEEDSQPSYSSQDEADDNNENENDNLYSTPPLGATDRSRYPFGGDGLLIGTLQATIVVLAMKGSISEVASHLVWKVLLTSLLFTTALIGLAIYYHHHRQQQYQGWSSSHRVGLYLILKNAIPSDSMILSSFFYSLFQSTPLQMQIISLVGMAMATLSSWSYGRLFSRFSGSSSSSNGNWHGLPLVIVATTILATLSSLVGNLLVVDHASSPDIFWVALAVKVVSTFFGEWEFLPEVVLATTSVVAPPQSSSDCDADGDDNLTNRNTALSRAVEEEDGRTTRINNNNNRKSVAVEYGTMISCIDFGDSLGSLWTGPLVAFLGIDRDNDFHNLDQLVLLCSLFSILSLGLIPLIRNQ